MTATTSVTAAFKSSLENAQLGPIAINRVRGSAQDVYRIQSAIRRSRANYYYLLCKTDGAWSVAHNGHMAGMKPGDVVLIDSRQPYEFHFPVSSDTISLELTPTWLESWLPDPWRIVGRPIDGDTGWGRALSGFVREMSPELAIARPLPAHIMIDQLGALLALASGTEPGGATETSSALAAVKDGIVDAVAERYAEPGLSAATIARDLGISERTFHRSLSRGGVTFAGLLRDTRMAAAARMLREPRFDKHSIAGIGLRVGFSDPSHFIRQCRRRLGLTPGALRRQRSDDMT